jgi:HlyD family secretion protein
MPQNTPRSLYPRHPSGPVRQVKEPAELRQSKHGLQIVDESVLPERQVHVQDRRALSPLKRRANVAQQLARSYDGEGRRGLKMLYAAGGIALLCGTLAPISGAVVVTGSMVAGTSLRKIQHPTGGVVAAILVKDGDHVASGDVIVRLNEVAARSTLEVLNTQLDELRARAARLTAERDGLPQPQWPADLIARTAPPRVARMMTSEAALFQTRTSLQMRKGELLVQHINQLTEEIAGLTAQVASREAQFQHVTAELTGLETLYRQQLVPLPRISAVRREAARLDGERRQLQSTVASTHSKIAEAKLQIVATTETNRSEVSKELSETQSKLAELSERQIAALDQFKRHEIRAPISGTVHQLAVHTIGGVANPGEVLMQIVPERDELVFEARLASRDIDQVSDGQAATIRFSAFNRSTTPELHGVVSYVAADASRDPQSGATHYTVRIALPDSELRRLDGLRLLPGMPADAFLETGSRSMVSYLLRPITDQMQRAFRER